MLAVTYYSGPEHKIRCHDFSLTPFAFSQPETYSQMPRDMIDDMQVTVLPALEQTILGVVLIDEHNTVTFSTRRRKACGTVRGRM